MAKQKFTVMLIPDDGGYQVIIPYYDNAIAWGATPDEAMANAVDALETILEADAEAGDNSVPYNVHASHVVVGDVEVEVPDVLMGEIMESRKTVKA